MDIAVVVSLIVGSTALAVSILGVLYSRQRTKIMEKQLEQQQGQLERKKRFEGASKTILEAVKMIKKYAKTDDFYLPWLFEISSEVLGYIHDNQLETVEINIRPQRLELHLPSFEKTYTVQDFKNVEQIIEVIKREDSQVTGSVLYFDCDQIIFSNPWVELGDIFYNFGQFYSAYRLLENYENEIVVFDNSILDDLKQNIDSLLKVLVESSVSEHKISISSADKSKQIFQKLLNEMIDLQSISALLTELTAKICDKRLIAIQREIFSKS